MQSDQIAIKQLISEWLDATAEGDSARLKGLMTDDAVFLLPGQAPMEGRQSFLGAFDAVAQRYDIVAINDIQEISVQGMWAHCWNHVHVTFTNREDGAVKRRAGYVLTILEKQQDGMWQIKRDANLMMAEP